MKLNKIFLALFIVCGLIAAPAFAGITGLGNPILKVTSPTTPAALISIVGCEDFSLIVDDAVGKEWVIQDCATSYTLHQAWPPLASELIGLNKAAVGLGNVDNTSDAGKPVSTAQATALSGKLNVPSGTSAQYLDGTGAPRSFSASSRTFNYPSRALASCFQISSSNDADFHYAVTVSANLSLTGGDVGTVVATSYTNSGCTTGAQVLATKQNGNTGTLTIGIATVQAVTVGLDGTLPAGKWMKITTAQTTGTPTFAIRTEQAETILP